MSENENPVPEAPPAEGDAHAQGDPTPQLRRLVDLAAKYPEIAPHLAELCFKIGKGEIGDQVVRMGLQGEHPGIEYFFVLANTARRDGRFADALKATLDAVAAFAKAPEGALDPDDGRRLMALVRGAFSTLMFDMNDVNADPAFVASLAEQLPALSGRLEGQTLYHVLLAQTAWFGDREKSEAEWDRAANTEDIESTWNNRGTWYKEAEKDPDKAEQAYRAGLDRAPHSALLLHNLGQLLVEKAAKQGLDPDHARRMLREAEDALRFALREDAPKGLRRHIHSTRDRLMELRASLPARPQKPKPPRPPKEQQQGAQGQGGQGGQGQQQQGQPRQPKPASPAADMIAEGAPAPAAPPAPPEPRPDPPDVGATVKGRVRSLAEYGAFISLDGGHSGLLHKSELDYKRIDDPSTVLKVGDEIEVKVLEVQKKEGGRPRIGLSRRALLPVPEGYVEQQQQQQQHRGGGGPGGGGPGGGGGGGGRDRDRGQQQGRGGGGGGQDRGPRREGGGGGGGANRPPRNDSRDDRRGGGGFGGGGGGGGGGNRPRSSKDDKIASLGEMLLAKLEEQKQK